MADEDILSQAEELDAQAFTSADPGTLRRQAAELRAQALGEKPYPVLICGVCFCLTGWLDGSGMCASDAWRRLEQSGRGFVDMRDLRAGYSAPSRSAWERARRALGIPDRRDRLREWLRQVVPDQTGPIDPEAAWEIESATKHERQAPEGAHLLIQFDVQSLRFERGTWAPIDVSRHGKPRTLVPRTFSASLPIDALAEAWNDFGEEVARHNRAIWQAESAARDARSRAAAERRDAEELERGTDRLLG